MERLLHLITQDRKNELKRLNLTSNEGTNRKLVNQAELEKHQGHIRLDTKFPFLGVHGRSIYDLHDKHWIPHIGTNNP